MYVRNLVKFLDQFNVSKKLILMYVKGNFVNFVDPIMAFVREAQG